MESLSGSQGRVSAPFMLLNMILTYDCKDAGDRATQELLPRTTMSAILLLA
jgi:hypothetical protein